MSFTISKPFEILYAKKDEEIKVFHEVNECGIRDPVHKWIPLSKEEKKILDSPYLVGGA